MEIDLSILFLLLLAVAFDQISTYVCITEARKKYSARQAEALENSVLLRWIWRWRLGYKISAIIGWALESVILALVFFGSVLLFPASEQFLLGVFLGIIIFVVLAINLLGTWRNLTQNKIRIKGRTIYRKLY